MEREKLISLVNAMKSGDENALGELYDAFYDSIYYHILKSAKDPELAADLTQDTFEQIIRDIHKLEEPAAFVTWSKQIAYHKWTDYAKKRKELLADENEDGYSVLDSIEEDREEFIPDAALDQEDLKKTIQNMIDSLPDDQRSALILRYFDEISVKEIAQIQGVSEGTVKSRLNYGRKAVKQSVEEYEKKHDVKLHCTGVVPLLLWFFRMQKSAKGAAATSTVFTSAKSATDTISSAVSVRTASTFVKAGTKVAGKSAAKKVIAGVIAAVVITGGIAAGTAEKSEEENTPQSRQEYSESSSIPTDSNQLPDAEDVSDETTENPIAPTVKDPAIIGRPAGSDELPTFEAPDDNDDNSTEPEVKPTGQPAIIIVPGNDKLPNADEPPDFEEPDDTADNSTEPEVKPTEPPAIIIVPGNDKLPNADEPPDFEESDDSADNSTEPTVKDPVIIDIPFGSSELEDASSIDF